MSAIKLAWGRAIIIANDIDDYHKHCALAAVVCKGEVATGLYVHRIVIVL